MVQRDGKDFCSVLTSTLVPGDIIELGHGDIVPADCRVLELKLQSLNIHVNQSHLTGEPDRIKKHPLDPTNWLKDHPDHIANPMDAVNFLFLGSEVDQNLEDRAQVAKCVVVIFTGDASIMGRIASCQ